MKYAILFIVASPLVVAVTFTFAHVSGPNPDAPPHPPHIAGTSTAEKPCHKAGCDSYNTANGSGCVRTDVCNPTDTGGGGGGDPHPDPGD